MHPNLYRVVQNTETYKDKPIPEIKWNIKMYRISLNGAKKKRNNNGK